jgi:hypothetical protein
MNGATNKTLLTRAVSSPIRRIACAVCLVAVGYGIIVADRYLKDWDPTQLSAQFDTSSSGPGSSKRHAMGPPLHAEKQFLKFTLTSPDAPNDLVELIGNSELALIQLKAELVLDQYDIEVPSVSSGVDTSSALRVDSPIFFFRMIPTVPASQTRF